MGARKGESKASASVEENDPMMFKTSVALLVCLVLSGSVARADAAAIRRRIDAQYAKMNEAIKRKDLKTFMDSYAKDYAAKQPGGKLITRSEEEANWKQMMAGQRSMKEITVSLDKLVVEGAKAVATVRVKATYATAGPKGPAGVKGKTRLTTYEGRGLDTWVKTPSGWRLKRSEPIPGDKIAVDGRASKSVGSPKAR